MSESHQILNLKRSFQDLHGFIIVLDTDVAAVGHIQTVPGPGVAIVAVVAGRGTFTDGVLPADRNNYTVCPLLFSAFNRYKSGIRGKPPTLVQNNFTP